MGGVLRGLLVVGGGWGAVGGRAVRGGGGAVGRGTVDGLEGDRGAVLMRVLSLALVAHVSLEAVVVVGDVVYLVRKRSN